MGPQQLERSLGRFPRRSRGETYGERRRVQPVRCGPLLLVLSQQRQGPRVGRRGDARETRPARDPPNTVAERAGLSVYDILMHLSPLPEGRRASVAQCGGGAR